MKNRHAKLATKLQDQKIKFLTHKLEFPLKKLFVKNGTYYSRYTCNLSGNMHNLSFPYKKIACCLNLRPDGGLLRAPLRFFSRLPENGGAARRRFWHTSSFIFFA